MLHQATYDNNFRITESLIKFYKLRLTMHLKSVECKRQNTSNPDHLADAKLSEIKSEVRKRVSNWINTPADSAQGFYPLHYASYHGNVKLIKLLMRNKADYSVQTKEGINVLHVAAQGDEAYSLAYFRHKGVSVMSRDK